MGPDPEKFRPLNEWPTPTTAKELSSFLVFVNFYLSQVGHMSQEARVLDEAASAERLEWTEQCEEVFQSLKWKPLNSPLRALPELSKDWVLSRDDTGYGIGGVLLQ